MKQHGLMLVVLGLTACVSWFAGASTDDAAGKYPFAAIVPMAFGLIALFAGLVLLAYSEMGAPR